MVQEDAYHVDSELYVFLSVIVIVNIVLCVYGCLQWQEDVVVFICNLVCFHQVLQSIDICQIGNADGISRHMLAPYIAYLYTVYTVFGSTSIEPCL